MAMNKKEQAAFIEITEESEINRALRWSDYETEYDVPKPTSGMGYVNGWSFNSYSRNVYKSWSGMASHGEGHSINGERLSNASQGAISQYSTEEKALKAMRRVLERNFATVLAEVDRKIKKSGKEAQ